MKCLMAIWLLCIAVLMAGETKAYLVVDLTSSGEDFCFTDDAPDLSNEKCRTTELWLRRIPAGSMEMDFSQERWQDGTSLQKNVTIDRDYYIGIFEVTKKQWSLIAGNVPKHKNGVVRVPGREDIPADGTPWSKCRDLDNYPVECVSYDECVEYVGKLSDRTGLDFALPTEPQWEYAHRINPDGSCTDTKVCYPEGDSPGRKGVEMGPLLRNVANAEYPVSVEYNTKVGAPGTLSNPTPMGLYDMSGNVWEWCQDAYRENEAMRVLRGGNSFFYNRISRCPQRDFCAPSERRSDTGLRVVCTPAS